MAEWRLSANVLRRSRLPAAQPPPRAQIQELVVGLREQDGKITGHAWVFVDDVSTVESESNLMRFSPVLRFGARGAILSHVRAGQARGAQAPVR